MLNGITVGIILVFVFLFAGFLLTMMINIFLAPAFKTPKEILDEIVSIMNLNKDDTLVDLGSGDGRLLFKAYEQSDCKCIGYDISPIMMITARTIKALRYPFSKNFLFEPQNIYKAEISKATRIYCYLDEKSMEILKPRFERFLETKGHIFSYKYQIQGIKNVEKIILSNDIPLYIY